MERHFDQSLNELKAELSKMGSIAEESIEAALQTFHEKDPKKIAEVELHEKKINQYHLDIDNACVKLLALQQPLAKDLRLIIAIIRINTDLERIGDQAINIALNAGRFLKEAPLTEKLSLIQNTLPTMTLKVKQMLRESLDSFLRCDVELAQAVLKKDDEVDQFKNQIFKDVKTYLSNHTDHLEQGLDLILIARNLERIGDHATNIAEDVIFAVSGKDVRHPQITRS